MHRDTRRGRSRRSGPPRAWWTLAWLLLACGSSPALAGGLGFGCTLVSAGLDNVVVEPNESMVFQFTIVDDGSTSCVDADGNISILAPQGSAILESGATFLGNAGDTIDIEVESTSTPGTATIDVNCPACSGSPLQYTITTTQASDWALDLVTPSDGDTVMAGDTITLTVTATDSGAPVSGELIRWDILGNTNNSAFIGATPPGTSLQQPTTSGQNTVQLAVGAPNAGLQPIQIRATIGYDSPATQESLDFTLFATDTVTVDSSNAAADGQIGESGSPVPVPYSVVVHRNGTADAQAGPIEWTASPAGAVVFASASTPTDGGGIATVTATFGPTAGPFTVTASHADYPAVIEVFTGETLPGGALTIQQRDIASGDNQSGELGTVLPLPLVAVVLDDGAPTDNLSVTWSLESGDAVLTGPNPVQTSGGGEASMTITLGDTVGTSIVRATLDDDPSQFVDYTVIATAITYALDRTPTESGNGQSAPVGSTLDPLRVVATNAGAPVSGAMIQWDVLSGDAVLAAATSPTDATGIAVMGVTLGNTPGNIVVRASRLDEPGVSTDFSLTATGSTAVVYTLTKPAVGSGDGQDGVTGEPLPQSLVVVANDDGVAAPGVTIQWAVTGGDATLDAPTSLTNVGGRASIGLTFGDTPGTVTVTATRADAPLATSTFVLTSSAAAPDDFGIDKPGNSGDGAALAAGGTLTLTARTLRNTLPTPFLRVAWEVVSGDAAVRPTVSTSADGGLATSQLVAGSSAGPIQVRASLIDAPDASVLYTINGATGGVLSIVSGNNQQGAPGAFLDVLIVSVTTGGVPTPGVPVQWTVIEGSATLQGTLGSTSASGRATTDVILGDTVGPVRVQATAQGQSVVFDLAVIGTAPTLTIVSGNAQSGPTETQADAPLVVEARNGDGTPLGGRNVQWEILGGAATLDAGATPTDAAGRAGNMLTFGSTAGAVTVLAYLPGLREQGVQFELDASAPSLTVHAGNGQTGAPGETLAEDFVVALNVPSVPGKGLAGVTVTWTVLEGGGTLSQATTRADTAGLARTRLTLGPQPGTQRVRATATGGASAEFTAMAVSVTAASIDVVSGSGQSLSPQTPSAPLVVIVRDAAGAPVADALVTWSGDNAAVASPTTRTGSDGRASTTARVLLPGAATVTASLDGGSETASFGINASLANIPGLTQPQRDVADAIDRFCPELASRSNLGAAQADLRARCLELINAAGSAPGDVADALEAMRQDVAFGQSNAAYAAVVAQFDNLKTRIAALRSGASGLDLGGLALASGTGVVPLSLLPADPADDGGGDIGSDFSRWGFFASGTIGRGSQDGDDATPEYDFDSNGLTAGVDYRISDTMIAGVSLGWNRQDTDLARDGGSIETRGLSLSAYSTWYRDNAWYLDGVLTFGRNDYDLVRNVRYALPSATGGTTRIDQRATASSDGEQRSLAVSFGRDFQKGAWSLGPYFRGTLTQVDFDAYGETMLADRDGAGLALAVDARDLESRTAVLGGKASYAMSRDWGVLMPHMQIEWEHELEDDPDALVARFLHDPTFSAIATQGEALDRSYYNVGFGLSALFPGGRSAFFYYERLIGASGQSQDNLSIGVRLEF